MKEDPQIYINSGFSEFDARILLNPNYPARKEMPTSDKRMYKKKRDGRDERPVESGLYQLSNGLTPAEVKEDTRDRNYSNEKEIKTSRIAPWLGIALVVGFVGMLAYGCTNMRLSEIERKKAFLNYSATPATQRYFEKR